MNLRVKIIAQKLLFRMGYHLEKISHSVSDFPILRPFSPQGVEILADKEFQAYCSMLGITSLLGTPFFLLQQKPAEQA